MPLDDLDRLLEMELGAIPERKRAEQVSSLEAQVLNRVQQMSPPEERAEPAAAVPASEPFVDPSLDPVYQYVEALLPLFNTIQDALEEARTLTGAELPQLRTQLAERLLSLPAVAGIDKPGLFAAMATCIDAAGSEDKEARMAALMRLAKLSQSLASARQQTDLERARAIDHFLRN